MVADRKTLTKTIHKASILTPTVPLGIGILEPTQNSQVVWNPGFHMRPTKKPTWD